MAWCDGPLLAFDVETTGVDLETDRLVSAAVLLIRGQDVQAQEWIINPGVPIPPGASAIHGIDDARAAAEGRPTAVAIPELLAAIRAGLTTGAPIVAFNAAFDLTLLDREARRVGVAPLAADFFVVDPFIIDWQVDRYRKGSRKLVDMAAHYHVPFAAESAHGATADALVTARIAWRLAQQYPTSIGAMNLADLHTAQVAWYREKIEDRINYDRGRGFVQNQPYRPEWPLVPFVG